MRTIYILSILLWEKSEGKNCKMKKKKLLKNIIAFWFVKIWIQVQTSIYIIMMNFKTMSFSTKSSNFCKAIIYMCFDFRLRGKHALSPSPHMLSYKKLSIQSIQKRRALFSIPTIQKSFFLFEPNYPKNVLSLRSQTSKGLAFFAIEHSSLS